MLNTIIKEERAQNSSKNNESEIEKTHLLGSVNHYHCFHEWSHQKFAFQSSYDLTLNLSQKELQYEDSKERETYKKYFDYFCKEKNNFEINKKIPNYDGNKLDFPASSKKVEIKDNYGEKDLEQLIENHFGAVLLDSKTRGNRICMECRNRNRNKTHFLARNSWLYGTPPKQLCIYLKRFKYISYSKCFVKNNDQVNFDKVLNLEKYFLSKIFLLIIRGIRKQ